MTEEVIAPVVDPAPAPVAPVAPAVSEPAPNPADPAPALTGEPVTPDPAVREPEKKGQARFERKISRLYREAAEQRARADLLESRLNESQPKVPDTGAPTLEQFGFDEAKYREAVSEHERTKVSKEFETKQRTQAQHAAVQRLHVDWEAKVTRAESKYEDFDSVVGELQPTTPWAVAVMKAENGEDVAHYLGTNMKEAQRIASLDPVDQFIEIGRLSAKLQATPVEPKTPSNAPPPIKPLGGSSPPSTKKLIDMPQDEFEEKRRRQIAARR